jgi:AcrR family transcriptional regulator
MKLNETNDLIFLTTVNTDAEPKRAKRADAIANRELILSTAQQLFAERGVSNICMAAIAEAAGVGKGTLYRGFSNKGELCLALMDEDMRSFQNKTLELFRDSVDQPALNRLDSFLDQLVRFMEFHAPLMCEVQKQGVLRNTEFSEQALPHMWLSWLHETIGLLLQQAEKNNEAEGLDIPYLVDAILAPVNADLFIYQREVLGFDPGRISDGLRGLVLRGIAG